MIVPALAERRLTTTAALPPSHDGLYGTCATLIIAVLVVLYFDERVRRAMSARTRGYAVAWLGGIIGAGVLPQLLAAPRAGP